MPGLSSKMGPGLSGINTSSSYKTNNLNNNFMFKFSNNMLTSQTNNTVLQNTQYNREELFCNLMISEKCNDISDWAPCTPLINCCTTQNNSSQGFMFDFDNYGHDHGHTHYLPIEDFDHHIKLNNEENHLESMFHKSQQQEMIDIERQKSDILTTMNKNIHNLNETSIVSLEYLSTKKSRVIVSISDSFFKFIYCNS